MRAYRRLGDLRAQRQQRIGHRVAYRRKRPHRARLAHPLDAALRERRRGFSVPGFDQRHIRRRRNQIIHQRPGQQLPPAIIDQFLMQSVADAQSHAAHHLPVHDFVVNNRAAILHADITFHLDHPRFPVNPRQRQMRPVAESLMRRVKGTGGLQPPLHAFRQGNHAGCIMRRRRHAGERHPPRRIGRRINFPIGDCQLLPLALQEKAGDLDRLALDIARRQPNRPPGADRAAADPGSRPERHGIGIALQHLDRRVRHAQLPRYQPGENAVVALAGGLGAYRRQHIAPGVHLDGRRIECRQPVHPPPPVILRPGAGMLHETTEADAHQFAPRPRLRLRRPQLFIPRRRQQPRQRIGVIAAVVQPPRRGVKGLVLRLDKVFHPHLRRIQPQLGGDQIHNALNHEHPLHRANAPIRRPGAFIGQDTVGIATKIVYPIRPNNRLPRGHRLQPRRSRPKGMRPLIHQHPRIDAQNTPIARRRHRHLNRHFMSVAASQQIFHPILNPLHRTVDFPGKKSQEDRLRVSRALNPELAAHIRRYDPHGVLRQPHHRRDGSPNQMRRPAGRPHRQPFLPPVIIGDHPAGFQRNRRLPRKAESLFQRQSRLPESAGHIAPAELAMKDDVIAHTGMNHRRIGR